MEQLFSIRVCHKCLGQGSFYDLKQHVFHFILCTFSRNGGYISQNVYFSSNRFDSQTLFMHSSVLHQKGIQKQVYLFLFELFLSLPCN